jgi:MFS family permease
VPGRILRSLTPDLAPLRESRQYRLLTAGTLITGLGTQASLVALPYQLYVITRSPVLVGLLGLVELGPIVVASLWGGAMADRYDRRKLLLLYQVALVAVAGALAAATFLGTPPIWLLYVLGGALAGAGQLERVTRSSIVPNVVRLELLRPALANTFGLNQLTMVVGPAIGGVLIARFGVAEAFYFNGASFVAKGV